MLKTASVLLAATLMLTACEADHHPSYDELKSENDELHAQLADTHEKVEQAKSELNNLRDQIRNLEGDPCHEDEAGDLGNKADDADSTLDEAEEETIDLPGITLDNVSRRGSRADQRGPKRQGYHLNATPPGVGPRLKVGECIRVYWALHWFRPIPASP
jgi:septal ring factor EnvC (AmiA/AmiB activator)